jgi:hypothetical protein
MNRTLGYFYDYNRNPGNTGTYRGLRMFSTDWLFINFRYRDDFDKRLPVSHPGNFYFLLLKISNLKMN